MQRALLGGTFDPPHLAHLVLGEAAYRILGVDTVTFLPTGDPWQKPGRTVTEARHRLAMLRAAVGEVSYFQVDDREIRRVGASYTIDTLETYPPDDDLWLVLGADAARGINSWHRAGDVLSRAKLAVAVRPGLDRADVEAAVGIPVTWLEMASINLSGTDIRRRLHEGQSVRFLVPDGVWSYIRVEGLYG